MTGRLGTDGGTCALRAGALRHGSATIPFVRGENVVTIRDVPAEVCGDCGEAYLSSAVTDRVQQLVQQLESLNAEVSVARYRAA